MNLRAAAWVWFALAQLLMLIATVLGWGLLPIPCLLRAWTAADALSIDQKPWLPARHVDRWKWAPLNWLYGNPADGVSGQAALIWGSGSDVGKLVPYMPGAWAPWRAYCWSAWRNSADALKYSLAITRFGTPSVVIGGRRIGWSVENGLPVLVI